MAIMDNEETHRDASGRDVRRPSARLLRKYVPLTLLALFMALAYQQGWQRYLSFEFLAEERQSLRAFVSDNYIIAVLGYFLMYVVAVALSIPGASFMTLAGGLLFGWMVGGGVTILAATVGATLIFLVAKTSLGSGLAKRAGPFVNKMAEGFRENAMSYLLFLRLVPVFPFWLVNLAPAILGVSLPIYFIGTLIGIIPGTLAFAFVGAGLDSIIDAQVYNRDMCLQGVGATPADCPYTFELSSVVTPELLIALVLLGVVALIPIAAKKYLSKNKSQG